MTSPITFSSLRRFLEGLGCQTHSVPGSHVSFKHARSGARIILRFYGDDEPVSPTDLAIVRRVLDDFGVVPRDDFDGLLQERALAS